MSRGLSLHWRSVSSLWDGEIELSSASMKRANRDVCGALRSILGIFSGKLSQVYLPKTRLLLQGLPAPGQKPQLLLSGPGRAASQRPQASLQRRIRVPCGQPFTLF